MLLKPFGFNRKAAAAGGGITITHITDVPYNEDNSSSYTFAGVDIGNLAITHAKRASGSSTPVNVTIDGNAAAEVFTDDWGAQATSIWYAAAATTGGTGDVVTDYTGSSMTRAFVRVMDVQGADMSAPFATFVDNNKDNATGSVTVTTVPVGGAIIAATRGFSGFTGLANTILTGDDPQVAWEVFPSGASSVAVTGVNAGVIDQDLVVIVLSPA